MQLGGLHHVTAVTGNAAGNLAFYTKVLGMRLVKKTVNQDDVSAYHLFYADGEGNAGTEVTFFDWPNSPPNRPGPGNIAAIGLRVADRATLDWWLARFDDHGVSHDGIATVGGQEMLHFKDPEGQQIALVADNGEGVEPGVPWDDSPVPSEKQIRGLAHIRLTVFELRPTAAVLTDVLGFRKAREYASPGSSEHQTIVFEAGSGGPGTEVHIDTRPDLPPGRVGIGGVHHVAFRTPTDEEHQQWQQHISSARIGVTPVIDRYYFRSIYFREPNHILYEIATDGPGFAVDEDAAHLGENLVLPPFLEPRREQIEAGLKPI
jgi:glyoxalase family protein